MDPSPPLILSFTLDEAAQQFFTDTRTREFPPERNVLDAHLTAFHALPGPAETDVLQDVDRYAPDHTLTVRVTGLRSLGRGVAYTLASDELLALRARLASGWQHQLTRQDAQRWSPHITVQNKVEPSHARATLERLQADFEPYDIQVIGITVWRYLGGPWEHVMTRRF